MANLIGCFGLGLLLAVAPAEPARTGLGVGLFGGLTTFSTFAVETLDASPAVRRRYVAASVVGGTALFLGGMTVATTLG